MSKSNIEYEKEITELKEEVAELKRQLSVLKKMAFGSKSEKTKQVETNPEQISLFNEAETEQSVSAREEEKEIVVTGHSTLSTQQRLKIYSNRPLLILMYQELFYLLQLKLSEHLITTLKLLSFIALFLEVKP